MENESLYNLNSLRSISGGDETFIHKMLALFIKQLNEFILEVPQLFSEKKYVEVAAEAHKLKSSLKTLQVKNVLEEVLLLENNCKAEKDLESVSLLIQEINKKLIHISVTLSKDFPDII